MSRVPFNKRPFDLFVSYSRADVAFVDLLVRWLRDTAALQVWWDATQLVAGDRFGGALSQGLGNARGALFCVSAAWNKSSWCEEEYNAALQGRRADRRFRLIALRLDDSQVPPFLANARYIEMRTLESESAAALLESLVPEPAPWASGETDVYFSRSWHPLDTEIPDRVATALIHDHGFRIVGDSPDYLVFEGQDRVRRIIEGCGGLVAVLPYRDEPSNGFTSKWILKEIQIANDLNRPYLLFGADGVKPEARLIEGALGERIFPSPSSPADAILTEALTLFADEFHPSPQPAYSFLATSLVNGPSEAERLLALVEHVTCMQCLLGFRLQGQHAQREIVERIRNAQFVVADITASNLNSFIEAGIARGAGTRLHLISKVPESGRLETRFMFRDLEVNWYRDPVERIGAVHRIARLYRRRVFNAAVA